MSKQHERDVHTLECKSMYMFNCPNCDGTIIVQINEVNCLIFRHGVYSQGHKIGQPINPHETKENIDKMVDEKLIDGCGKPIQMNQNHTKVYSCSYV